MAAANEVIKVTISQRWPIGSGRAIYQGTAQGGTEYKTGGVALTEEATNSRAKLPEKIDNVFVQPVTGITASWLPTGLLKLNGATTTEGTVAVEFKSAATMAVVIPAGTPITIFGDA